MNLIWILLVILIVVALVGSPAVGFGPWAGSWGPSGGIGLIVVVLLVLLLLGRI